MPQEALKVKMMQIGGDKQEELQAINDQLKLALRDHKTVQTLLTSDPENVYAKEEVFRLRLLINTLAQNQKLILREIRKKDPEPVVTDAAKPKENKSLPIVQAEANNAPNDISSKEKENESTSEPKTVNPPLKDDSDTETVKIFKKDQTETQEQDMGKSFNSVAPLGERPKHVDNMLANNETANTKPLIACATANGGKMENENDSAYGGAAWFLAVLELMPTHKLQQQLRTTERKRAIRQKRSTANHSQFVYDDSWDQDEKKKKKKDKDALLKVNKPAPIIATDTARSLSRKQEMMLARQQLLELESKSNSSQPPSSTVKDNGVFLQRKNSAPSIFRPSKQKMQKIVVPKPYNPVVTESKQEVVELEAENDAKCVPNKIRKVMNEPKKKRPPQKKPIDFSLERLSQPGWNTTVGLAQQRDASSFASNINSIIQSAQVPPGLSLKIPGLPASLTIERISEQQRVCCMCRKPALVTGLFGDGDASEKISDALTSCNDCGMTYHLSCTRSTSTSNEFHICPHCFTRQTTYPSNSRKLNVGRNQKADTATKSNLVLEKLRLISEQESLDKKILELSSAVTCTFTRNESKPQN